MKKTEGHSKKPVIVIREDLRRQIIFNKSLQSLSRKKIFSLAVQS